MYFQAISIKGSLLFSSDENIIWNPTHMEELVQCFSFFYIPDKHFRHKQLFTPSEEI